MICTETTSKVLNERRLREAYDALDLANAQLAAESGRLKGLFEQAPSFMAVLRGPDHVVELTNASYLQLVGRRDLIGKPVRKAVPEAEGQGFFELLDQVYATGEAFVGRGVPIILEREGVKEQRFLDFVYQPIVDVSGMVNGVFVDGHDVTEHFQIEVELRASEARFRALADAMPQLVWTAHPDGAIHWYNQGWYRYTGTTPDQMAGWGWQSVHDPEVLPSVMTRWQACIASGKSFEMTFPLRGEDGQFRPFLTRVIPQKDDQGRVLQWFGTNTDVEELHRAEEAQNLLLREMDHRVKNLFAVVSGIVALSARTAPTPRALADAVQGRLGALADAHNLVRPQQMGAERETRETTMAELIRTVLTPHIDATQTGAVESVVIRGPQVTLAGEAATSFALIFHEFATNAAKYGALSVAGGRIAITWSVSDGRLEIDWSEQNGPVVEGPPPREGFGSLLARRSVQGLGGQLAYDWRPKGLAVRMSAALERLGG